MVESLHKMVVVVDRNYRYLIANRAFLQYSGKTKEDIVGRHVAEVTGLEVFRDTIKKHLDDCFSGKFIQYEMTYRYPKLGERQLLIEYLPIQGPGGIDRVACLKRDVTDQKKADHALLLFRALIEQSNDAIEVVDSVTLRFLDVNDKACQDLGYTREELLGMSVLDIDPTTHASSHAAFMEKLRAEGSVVSESIHQRKNGSTFPVEISIKYVELDNGYFVTVARDITDRKRAEVALRESEDRYRDLVEHSEDLVCTHDLRGNLVSVNAGACRVLGYEVGELLGIPMREFIAPEFRGQFEQYLERIITNGVDSGFLCVLAKDGRRRIWETSSRRWKGITSFGCCGRRMASYPALLEPLRVWDSNARLFSRRSSGSEFSRKNTETATRRALLHGKGEVIISLNDHASAVRHEDGRGGVR